jgi:hypothetical protein
MEQDCSLRILEPNLESFASHRRRVITFDIFVATEQPFMI